MNLLIYAVLMTLLSSLPLHAQNQAITEDFENGIPSTWVQDPVTGVTPWSVSASGLSAVTAYSGQNYLSLYSPTAQGATKIIIPSLVLSNYSAPVFSFYLMQQTSGADSNYLRDTLRVYTRPSSATVWSLSQTFSTPTSNWERKEISLLGLISDTIDIAFEYVYGGGLGLGIDYLRVGDSLMCYTPNPLGAYRISSNSAALMWEAYEGALSYSLKVSTTPIDPITMSGDILDLTNIQRPYTLTGLTSSTSYFYYVKADCGDGDVSPWSNAGQFTTLCTPKSLPYSQNFDSNDDFYTCWTREVIPIGNYWSTNTTLDLNNFIPTTTTDNSHSGTTSIKISGVYGNNSATGTYTFSSYIASPELNTNNLSQHQISFWVYCNANPSFDKEISVNTLSDPNDLSTFHEIAAITLPRTNRWEEFIIPLIGAQPTDKHVALYIDGIKQRGRLIYIDDIQIDTIPHCPKASNLEVTNLTHNQTTLNWSGMASSWQVKINTLPLSDPTTQAANVRDTIVSTKPLNLTNLSSNTQYYVYIRALCSTDSTGYGEWNNEFSFTTTPTVAEPPYYCDFENYTENAQWRFGNGIATNQWFIGTATNNGGDHSLYISNDNGVSNAFTESTNSVVNASRLITLTPGSHLISFDWRSNGILQGTIQANCRALLVPTTIAIPDGRTTGSSNLQPILYPEIIDITSEPLHGATTWQHFERRVFITDTTTYNLVFEWNNRNSSNTQPPTAIDNISITTLHCTSPAAINTSDIGVTTADLYWLPNGESQWQVQVLHEGTVILDTTTTSNTLSLSNLSENTEYIVQVRGVCSSTNFGWWTTMQLVTNCSDITTLPYIEDFENLGTGAGAFPPCWNIALSNGNYPMVPTAKLNHTPYSTSQTGALYCLANSSTKNNLFTLNKLAVPGKTIQDMRLSFYGAKGILTASTLSIGVMTNPTDPTTFTEIANVSPSQTSTAAKQNWELFEIDFSSYTGNGEYIAFYDGTRKASNQFYIDDIRLDLRPNCERLIDITLADIEENSVSATYSHDPSITEFEAIALQSGDSLLAQNVIATATTNGDTITLNGLSTGTLYDLYIRAICSPGDTSGWSDKVTIRTTEITPLPYSTTFADTTDNAKWLLKNGEQTNKWYIGNAVGSGDSLSLYISDNNGLSHSYTGTASYVSAYRTFHFEPGIYRVSFDWICNGVSTTASTATGIRAFLVPTNENIKGGVSYDKTAMEHTNWIAITENTGNSLLNMSSTWQNLQQDIYIPQATDYHLLFFWKNGNSAQDFPPAGAIDNVSITPLGCAAAVSHDCGDVYDIVTFTPANCTSVIAYEYLVDTTSIDLTHPESASIHAITTNAVDTIVGLTPYTNYYGYVRTICTNNDTGLWAQMNFKTECNIIKHFPYTWSFDDEDEVSNSIPNCWTKISTQSTYPCVYSYSNAYSGDHVLRLQSAATASSGPCIIASPRLHISSIRDYRLEFYTFNTSANHCVAVGVMEDLNDINTLTPIDTICVSVAKTWEKQTVNFKNYTGNGKYIVFFCNNGLRATMNSIYIDDISIHDDRICLTPSNLGVQNLTSNNAQIYWNSNNAITSEVYVTSAEVDPDTIVGNAPEVVLHVSNITQNHFDLSGNLTPNTTYWFYVKADCQATDGKLSLWSDGYMFTTPCPSYTLPFSEDFVVNNSTAETAAIPNCWHSIIEQHGNSQPIVEYPVINTNVEPFGSNDSCALKMNCYFRNSSSQSSNTSTYVVLPEFSGSFNDQAIQFFHKNQQEGIVNLLIGTISDIGDGSTFTPFDTILVQNFWDRYAYNLSTIPNNPGTHLALQLDGDLNQNSASILIDNLSVDTCNACSMPRNLRVTDLGRSLVAINVNTLSNSDSIVEITISQDSVIVRDTILSVNNLPWIVRGLESHTQYSTNARVVCDSANDIFSPFCLNPTTFTTSCKPLSLPYTENFENEHFANGQALEDCWTVNILSPTATSRLPHYNETGFKSKKSISIYGDRCSYVITPELDIDSIQNLSVSFDASQSYISEKLEVGIITDPNDPSTFVPIDSMSFGSAWTRHFVDFKNYSGNGRYIAFVFGRKNQGCIIKIDNIEINEENACSRPSLPVQVSNTTTSINASWESGICNESIWEVAVLPYGQQPDETTMPVQTVYTPQVSISGLTPSTQYGVFVRSVCSSTEHSKWQGTTMSTICGPHLISDSVSLVETFNDCGIYPNCWTTSTTSPSSLTYIYDDGALELNNSSALSVNAVSPELYGTPLNQIQIRFKGRSANKVSNLSMGVMTNPNDPTSFTFIQQVQISNTEDWRNYIVNLRNYSGSGSHVAFVLNKANNNNISSKVYIDDVVIEKMSQCSAPDFSITEIDRDTLQINITPNLMGDSIWQVVVTPQSLNEIPDFSEAVLNQTTTNTQIIFTNYASQTNYMVYVRSVCGSDSTEWNSKVITTPCGRYLIDYTHSLSEDFNNQINLSEPDCWKCEISGTSYSRVELDADSTDNKYMSLTGTSQYRSYFATPELTGLPINKMEIRFKAKIGSAPNRFQIGVMTDPNDVSTFTPTDTIHAQQGEFDWNDYRIQFRNYEGNGHYIAFFSFVKPSIWRFDDITIMPISQCSAPYLTARVNDYNDVEAIVAPAHPADSLFECVVTPLSANDSPIRTDIVALDTLSTDNSVAHFTTLTPNTVYSLYARALCGTDWARQDFITPCEAVIISDSTAYSESFDNDGTGPNRHPSCWTCNTSYTTAAMGYPFISGVTQHSGTGALYFYSSDAYYSYATTPRLTGVANNRWRVEFFVSKSDANQVLEVGVMTDPNDYSTFTTVQTVSPVSLNTFEPFVVDFAYYNGNGQYVAFRAPQGTNNSIYLDDVVVSMIPECAAPIVNPSFNNGILSVELQPQNAEGLLWEVVIDQNPLTPDTVAPLYHQTLTTTNLSVAVSYSNTYYIHVRTECSYEWSDWGTQSFTTPCGVVTLPYAENFDLVAPYCWNRYTGLLNNVISGNETLIPATGGWIANSTNCWSNSHATLDIFGSNVKHWLVTPEIAIENGTVIDFDLALTDYNSSNPIARPNGQQDDRFVVLVSRDGGNTWNANDIVAEWNNTGSSHTFNTIAHNGNHMQFYLGNYAGDTIQVAFYGESTQTNGDNDLHLDNLRLHVTNNMVTLTDQVCESNRYLANGFDVYEEQPGTYTYYRANNDTIYSLILTVLSEATETIDMAVCDNDLPYAWNGQDLTATGVYTFNTTASNGCDSVVTLNLTVNNSFAQTDSLELMDTDLPYTWNGQELTEAGVYTFNGTTAEGCDSVITLVLDVKVGIDYTDDTMFAISPNPVERGGKVRIDANINETAVVEIYTSNGKLVSRSEHQAKPIFVTMPEVGGLYMVRLTTETGRVMYGKVIVK